MNSKKLIYLSKRFFIVFCLLLSASLSMGAENCQKPLGKLVSIQGKAQVQRDGQLSWQTVEMDAEFCPGDMLRVRTNGRTTVVLRNETVLRLDQNSTIQFSKISDDNSSLLKILSGILHIFSHRPHSLEVVTPYVNGVVKGTEFLVRVDTNSSVITVFEGVVAAANQLGQLNLSSGQSALATKDTAPKALAVVRPRDAVLWTLYYPPVIEPSLPHIKDDIIETVRRAATLLSVGRVDEAEKLLAEVLLDAPDNSEALAISSIIETVKNNKENALELALRAQDNNPKSASANLALSYAYQARFDIPAALKTLKNAAEFTPDNGLVKARLAELFLAVGEFDKSLTTAREAASLNPAIALSHTVLGFVYLSRIEIEEALAEFNAAIKLDSASPLARLGLGLARIREGELAEGRAEIEIAAALDPGNSLIRSYLGKAYFEEKRTNHARRQYQIAKELDPADPTPWFYDAIRKQTINRPVEALQDVQRSIELNDNRAVYRSRLLLDNDLAARSAGLGRIYNDLGFQQLALVEGWKSIQTDPTNYSAHRFLADSYSVLPRHEVARVSELLRSQLLQPLNVTPVQPQLAESNLAILEGAGPSLASFNEFNPLFLRNRVALQASGVAGSNDTFGDELVVSGIKERFSYSLGQFHYQTEGIRDNNDQEQDIYNGFLQMMLSPATSLLAEVRYREKDFGDLAFQFDPTDFSSTLRQAEESRSARLGVRHNLSSNSQLLGTAIISADEDGAATGSDGFSLALDINSEVESQMVEVQHIYSANRFNLQSGGGYLNAEETVTEQITFPFTSFSEEKTDGDHTTLYSYAQINFPYKVQATVGLSGDLLNSPSKDREEINPKLGLIWQPKANTLIRASAFKTVTRRFIHAQTLEPTLIAGFNQFFDDLEASVYWTYGVGIDQKFAADWYGGLQFFHRDLEVPYIEFDLLGNSESKLDDWSENIGSAYLYWAPVNWMTLGLEYFYEHYSHDQFEGVQGIRKLTSHRVTPQIRFFTHQGISAKLQTSYISQKGEFEVNSGSYEEDSDNFWIFDFSISYRLPKRFGIFKLEVKNLFDEQFQFLDTDPARPRYLQDRQVIASLTFSF